VVDAHTGELITLAGPLVLAASKRCWVKTPRQQWLACESLTFIPGLDALLSTGFSGRLRVSLNTCKHRSQAEELQQSELGLEANELERLCKTFWRVFNWIDWQAFCPKGSCLGRVQEVLASKSQAVLRLEHVVSLSQDPKPPHPASSLVPVVPRYVLKVLPAERRLVLDWTI
jgi:ribosomal 30S subunit maturation factor RimM